LLNTFHWRQGIIDLCDSFQEAGDNMSVAIFVGEGNEAIEHRLGNAPLILLGNVLKKCAQAEPCLFMVAQPNAIEQFSKEFWRQRLEDRWRFERDSGHNIPRFELVPAEAIQAGPCTLVRARGGPHRI
jgi:hypothetical protein